jgi:hypothetical protein
LSAVAGELANRAAQAAADAGPDEQPTHETVYVLNPSHQRLNLEINQPVTFSVNGYRVTQEGYQIERDALISLLYRRNWQNISAFRRPVPSASLTVSSPC